jgi:hypothetical protein
MSSIEHKPIYTQGYNFSGTGMADRGWKRQFDDPIPLPRGRQLTGRLADLP